MDKYQLPNLLFADEDRLLVETFDFITTRIRTHDTPVDSGATKIQQIIYFIKYFLNHETAFLI